MEDRFLGATKLQPIVTLGNDVETAMYREFIHILTSSHDDDIINESFVDLGEENKIPFCIEEHQAVFVPFSNPEFVHSVFPKLTEDGEVIEEKNGTGLNNIFFKFFNFYTPYLPEIFLKKCVHFYRFLNSHERRYPESWKRDDNLWGWYLLKDYMAPYDDIRYLEFFIKYIKRLEIDNDILKTNYVFFNFNFYIKPDTHDNEDEDVSVLNRFFLFYFLKKNELSLDFIAARYETILFNLTKYSQFFRFFFPINNITYLNRYPFSFFLTSNLTFINHKKKTVSNIIMAYIKPQKRIFVTLKFLKLFLTFRKNIFFSDRVYYLLKFGCVSKIDYLNKFVNTLFKNFNKNLNNKFIKSNLGFNKTKYEKELLEDILSRYAVKNDDT